MTSALPSLPPPRFSLTAYVTLATGLVDLVTLRSFLSPQFILNLEGFLCVLRLNMPLPLLQETALLVLSGWDSYVASSVAFLPPPSFYSLSLLGVLGHKNDARGCHLTGLCPQRGCLSQSLCSCSLAPRVSYCCSPLPQSTRIRWQSPCSVQNLHLLGGGEVSAQQEMRSSVIQPCPCHPSSQQSPCDLGKDAAQNPVFLLPGGLF